MGMFGRYYEIFKKASKIDIFDVAVEYSYEPLNILSLGPGGIEPADLGRKGIIKRICIFFWHLFESAGKLWQKKGARIPNRSFIFFVMSKNENDALQPIFDRVPDSYWVGYHCNASNSLTFFWAYVLSCIYFPLVALSFLRSKGYKRKSFSYVFDHYLIVYGLYIVARLWFDRVKPKALILSNALNPYHRVLAKAARDGGLLTIYLQHASVPENTPPLDFDYALLEGYDALRTYTRFGLAQTRVYLIGMPKYDPHCGAINQRATIFSVGVCTSTLNSVGRAEELCSSIRQEFAALPVILRVHNADPRVREWKELAQKYALEFSDSKVSISFDFLKGVDLIIAGDSNILLEAALMNVVPLYYGFDQGHLDYYRFHRNGLVQYFSEPHEICRVLREMLQDRPSVRMKAKEYCATLGTRYDGRSSEIAGALIQELASNNVDLEGWKRIPNINAEAYELTYAQNSV